MAKKFSKPGQVPPERWAIYPGFDSAEFVVEPEREFPREQEPEQELPVKDESGDE